MPRKERLGKNTEESFDDSEGINRMILRVCYVNEAGGASNTPALWNPPV
jgi:hypothetical protein